MSSSLQHLTRIAAFAAALALCSSAFAQSDDDADPELRIQRLENQLRQLTGQNEELQYRNRQLEERLKQLQGGTPGGPQAGAQPAPGASPPAQPNTALAPPLQIDPGYRQQGTAEAYPQQPQGQPGGYAQPQQQGQPQIAAPAPIVGERPAGPSGQRRGDAFDPNQNPNAPGAPRALGGGQLPVPAEGGMPVARGPAGPQASPLQPQQGGPNGAGALATAPPSGSPRDEYDLGIGYMQHKDYAQAEQTMRNFTEKFPNDPQVGDAQFWLGESLYQRQQYRDAAEVFLAVTTKYEKSAKAPDAMLRLGQSLGALKEKEAACAALGEVGRKFPRASASVKSAVDREQKRVKC